MSQYFAEFFYYIGRSPSAIESGSLVPPSSGPSDDEILASAACARGDEDACEETQGRSLEEEPPLAEVCQSALWRLTKERGTFIRAS